MPVIVPPAENAASIVSSLHQALAELDRTTQQIEAIETCGIALRRAVLAAAFEGRLTGRRTDLEIIEEHAFAV